MRVRWLAVLLVLGCRTQRAPDATAIDVALPAPDTLPAARARAAPEVVTLGAIDQVLLSVKGRLAFLIAKGAFAVVDTRTGAMRRYRGEIQRTNILGFDNRCDVSMRGYMPNVDVWSAETNRDENVFVRTVASADGGRGGEQVYRERFAQGTSLPLPGSANARASAVETDTSYVPDSADALLPLPAGAKIVDSNDASPRSVIASSDGIDDFSKRWALPLEGEVRHLGLDTSVVVTVAALEAEKSRLCAHDLATSKKSCVDFVSPSPFSRLLVSDDGARIAFAERLWGSRAKSKTDEYERDSSSDSCFLHVLDRRTGKDIRFKSTCTMLTETPLRFEGDELVTDAAKILRCTQSIYRRYDAKTGAFKGQTLGPAPREDVDDALLLAMKKEPQQGLGFFMKQSLWPKVYGEDELVTWSEGESVLSRKGADLRLCTKRGAQCKVVGAAAEGAMGSASRDGAILGAYSRGRFVAIDARSGSKLVDLPIE